MSYCVMVVGTDIEKELAPFHEFRCTGRVDEYVQSVDILPTTKEAYEKNVHRYICYPDGKLVPEYDCPLCYRDPTPEELKKIGPLFGTNFNSDLRWTSKDWDDGKGYRPKVFYVPDGYTKVNVPLKDIMTFLDYVRDNYNYPELAQGEDPDLLDEHKWGWVRVKDGEVVELIERTNPNAKWGHYGISWSANGYFRLKSGGTADTARKSEIDIEGMRNQAAEKAAARFDHIFAIKQSAGFGADEWWRSWQTVLTAYPDDIKAAGDAYWTQPLLEILMSSDMLDGDWKLNRDLLLEGREAYIQQAWLNVCCTYAYVKDFQWHSKGEMAHQAISYNESTDWEMEFAEFFDSLPDDATLTVVDCHI